MSYYFKIITSEEDICKYETGLYKAFYKIMPDKWIQKNYIKTSSNKIKPFIPYQHLIIYGGFLGEKLVCGNAVNVNMEISQIHKIGFKYLPDKKTVEGLNTFTLFSITKNPLLLSHDFFNHILIDLKSRGYTTFLATCTEQLKTFYEFFGVEFIDEKFTYHEKDYLVKCTF